METPYDRVAYPTFPQAYAFPAQMGALAALCGVHAPMTRDYAGLEVACGSGEHLLAMAIDAPDASFEGFDLSRSAIEAGEALRRQAEISNARLRVADILSVDVAPGSVDYAVVHGFYAWAPSQAREGALRLLGKALSPSGVAAVSFNVIEGCASAQSLRERIRPLLEGLDEGRRLERAKIELEAARRDDPDPDVRAEADFLLSRDPRALFHDEFGDVYAPVSLAAFMAAARAQGLVCLCDVEPRSLPEAFRPRPQNEWEMLEIARDGRERTRFRRMLLARAGAARRRGFAPAALRGLYACADLMPERGRGDSWWIEGGGRVSASDSSVAAWLSALSEQGEDGLPLDALASDYDARTEALLSLAVAGVVELRNRPRGLSHGRGDAPVVTSLARAQLRCGASRLASLRGGAIELDEPLRRLASALDGRSTLADAARAAGLTLEAARYHLREFRRMGLMTPHAPE